jgi:hypothetical protein
LASAWDLVSPIHSTWLLEGMGRNILLARITATNVDSLPAMMDLLQGSLFSKSIIEEM